MKLLGYFKSQESSIKKKFKVFSNNSKKNYGVIYGIKFNPVKKNWFCANVFCKSVDVEFKICGQNILFTNYVAYVGVKLMMRRGKLVDMNDRIRKFNNCAYDVLVNAKGLNEVVMCKLIKKKCLPVLMYAVV
jgi:hypothetical protein